MPTYQSVPLAGTEVWLLPDKALFWPAEQALLIADAHFGKAAAFRRLGQPVPSGTTEDNLQRLDALLEAYPSRQLFFLGDFLHAPESRSEHLTARLARWRRQHIGLAITLIRGNHDRRAGDPPRALDIDVVDEPLLLGPLALRHEPEPHPTHHVLAGHLHPAFRLRGRERTQLRLPCFCLDEAVSLLPAFGAFTGAMEIRPAPQRRIFVVAEGAVWPVATSAR
ncbi:ligase-associated DNA damage response endonuclease PdeM [Stutzerimonas tarimensis]|uniref:Ligase-associated DNA damage response endonuclease PdeM n=1 Tax=Stutzerimonas tarimensis TaxID=1507735 RepID=A0ABV7T7J7_9GAMM